MYTNPFVAFRSKAYLLCKELYQLRNIKDLSTKRILFIIGCQRSGTSLMTRILNKDWNAKVYFEDSNLSVRAGEERLRLKPLPIINEVIGHDRFPLIVLKPLVETQNAVQLLDYFPNSRAIWMYRHYKDVVHSNLRKFGLKNGVMNLRYIAEYQMHNWRVENVPDSLRQIVLNYFSETMDPYDAAALFWYVRNSFFFELSLEHDARVMLCKYDKLITCPRQTMNEIYRFLTRSYPGDHLLKMIHTSSIGGGQRINLSPEIQDLCEHLWNRLEYHNRLLS